MLAQCVKKLYELHSFALFEAEAKHYHVFAYDKKSKTILEMESLGGVCKIIKVDKFTKVGGIKIINYVRKHNSDTDFSWDDDQGLDSILVGNPIYFQTNTMVNKVWKYLMSYHFEDSEYFDQMNKITSIPKKKRFLMEFSRRFLYLKYQSKFEPYPIHADLTDEPSDPNEMSIWKLLKLGPTPKRLRKSKTVNLTFETICSICNVAYPKETDITCKSCKCHFHSDCFSSKFSCNTILKCAFCWFDDQMSQYFEVDDSESESDEDDQTISSSDSDL